MKNDLVELGTCHRPHGIKGEFSFSLYNRDSSVIKKGSLITLVPISEKSSLPKEGAEYSVSKISFGNKVICQLNEVQDRNTVESMVPFKILFPREKFPVLESGEVYYYDFIGLEVIDAAGMVVGKIENFFENNGQLILALKYEDEKLELPYVEPFFPSVDWDKRQITLIPPENY